MRIKHINILIGNEITQRKHDHKTSRNQIYIYIYIFLKALMTKSIVFRTTSVKMEEAENQTTKS